MATTAISIAGGGLAGLAAALAAVRGGAQARVMERRREIGARFHGDFQGLENWTTEGDVLDDLAAMGIDTAFDHAPFHECVFFDPDGREFACRSSKPLWYLVRRGADPGTLDQALKAQALREGVEIQFGQNVEHLPGGGIVAHGPRRVDAIAVGYVFSSDRADAAFGAVSDELAPAGYAYLLICRGRATLATCMFDDFHNDKQYLARTVEFFQRKTGITLPDAKPFGGYGNMAAEPTVRRGALLLAGEAAGLQDALFGFGMRYALTSGHLAGLACATGDLDGYEAAYRRRIRPLIRAATVNRYLYGRAGTRGYRALVERVSGASDPRAWLRTHYAHHWWTSLIHPIARKYTARLQAAAAAHECREGCDCTYCRCVREAAGASTDDGAAGVEGARRDEHHAAVAQTGAGGEATSCH